MVNPSGLVDNSMRFLTALMLLVISGCGDCHEHRFIDIHHSDAYSRILFRCFECGSEEWEVPDRQNGYPLTYTCGKCWDAGRVGMMRPVEKDAE